MNMATNYDTHHQPPGIIEEGVGDHRSRFRAGWMAYLGFTLCNDSNGSQDDEMMVEVVVVVVWC